MTAELCKLLLELSQVIIVWLSKVENVRLEVRQLLVLSYHTLLATKPSLGGGSKASRMTNSPTGVPQITTFPGAVQW